ncbi:glycosyltransferase family 10 domain-containing protein [Halosegnis rubeus]|uniref:Fucosyltransferase C-terminal domain-containing protein n=1 Tax=Halosegnis rubeus TaxID=2212850 RepID=A0A5N5UKU5_9EURY|nr:glycosyltransferase family 10 [Halosegnis rubeus]KAB7519442.1 hypothetical protein DP108_04890 [Halosegnis rubeus]
MTDSDISVYFAPYWTSSRDFLADIRKQTPGKSATWGDVDPVHDPSDADYHIGFDKITSEVDSDRLILFDAEPPCIPRSKPVSSDDVLYRASLSEQYKPQRWFLDKNYDTLSSLGPIEKTQDLSWITTDKGRDLLPGLNGFRHWMIENNILKHRAKDQIFFPGLRPITSRRALLNLPTDGHIIRMDFLDALCERYPSVLDLFGRGSFSTECYLGEINNKWTGLGPYRYTLAIENYKGPNFFTEKLADAFLSWCMPICWGCTNLDKYFPEKSYIQIDIEEKNAPEQIKEVTQSNLREKNIDAIAEARRRILKYYQIWPTINRCISKIE